MFIEEYGFNLEIYRDESNTQLFTSPVIYRGAQLVRDESVVALSYHGKTIADVGQVWRSDESDEKIRLARFDSYRPLIIGNEKHSEERTMSLENDICYELLAWTVTVAEKFERRQLAQAIREFMCLSTNTAGGSK